MQHPGTVATTHFTQPSLLGLYLQSRRFSIQQLGLRHLSSPNHAVLHRSIISQNDALVDSDHIVPQNTTIGSVVSLLLTFQLKRTALREIVLKFVIFAQNLGVAAAAQPQQGLTDVLSP